MSAKQRRKKMLLALSLVLLCLVLWISNIIWREGAKRAGNVPATATTIVIRQNSKQDLEFVRRNEQWYIVTAEEQPVLAERLDPLIRMSLIPIGKAYSASEVDLVAAGLDNPVARVTIDDNTIALGNKDSSGDRRYAMQKASVYFVPEWTLSLIQGGPSAFIETTEAQ